jgi:hypothetical protein
VLPLSGRQKKQALSSLLERTIPARNLDRLEYPIEMVQQCGLAWQDIFVPKPAGQKPIEVKKWRPAQS